MRQIRNISIAANDDELADKFIEIFVDICTTSIAERGRFTVALSGGSTPEKLYLRLSKESLEWDRVVVFFGDERCVAADHQESNFCMASDALLKPVRIADAQIFRWQTELENPEKIAADYTSRVSAYFSGTPRFDLCLLGIGADGHTASLFPGTAALNETRVAVANLVPKLDAFRLTLTPPAINNSRNVLFLVSGGNKADAVAAIIDSPYKPQALPAQLIKPSNGRLIWLLDEAAASGLNE